MRPVFTGLFLFFSFVFNDINANEYHPIIEKIEIIGLYKTKNYVIKREILHPINVKLDSSIADLDKNRIFNLGLFDIVSWQILPLENGNATLQYFMIESINRTPPLIFPSYDEERGWSLNGIIVMKNFQGKNRTLELFTSVGGQEKLQFLINDPWVFGNHVSLSALAEYNTYDHLFLNRLINIKKFTLRIGKWYGEKIKFRISPTITLKNFLNSIDTLNYKYFSPTVNLELDTRDIFWNPEKGVRIIQSIVPMLGKNSFYVWNQSFSFYFPIIYNTTLAFNTSIQKKHGHKSDVWMSYFGNSFNIRGWKLPGRNSELDNFRFGHDYIYSSFELRKLVFKKSNDSLIFTNGLCFVAFVDGGIISDEWNNFNKNKFIGGVGVGVRVPIPILQSLRIDIGWGYKNKKFFNGYVFHFAIKQKF